jgi:hypothetical protein
MIWKLLGGKQSRADTSGAVVPRAHDLTDVEITPRFYRSGPLTATFTHKGAFIVRKGNTTIAGAPHFRDYEGVLASIIDDDMEDPGVREAATTILETARRSLYDQYIVVEDGSGDRGESSGDGNTTDEGDKD